MILAGIILAVAWLAVAAVLASRKGYPAWVGTLLVTFLPILGLVILVLLPKRDRSPRLRAGRLYEEGAIRR